MARKKAFELKLAPPYSSSDLISHSERFERARAEGGKLLGAGGGGFLMFMAPPERHDAVRAALGGLRETPFGFASHGSRIIFVHE